MILFSAPPLSHHAELFGAMLGVTFDPEMTKWRSFQDAGGGELIPPPKCLIQYAMSDRLKIDKHHAAFRFRFVDRSFVPLAYARDPGLFNAVLNVCFDPRTAKRRSFKDTMGEQKKNVQTAGKMV